MIFEIPTLETERLILRPLKIEDAEDVFQWTGDERVAKYMIYSIHQSVDETIDWLSSLSNNENEYTWGFVRKSDGKLIGSGGMRFRKDENKWSFGYNFRFDCWNHGYATEATKAMIKYGIENHDVKTFISEHAVENSASGRVMVKCGLHCIGESEYTCFDGVTKFKSLVYEMNVGK